MTSVLMEALTAAARRAGHTELSTLLAALQAMSPSNPIEAAVLAGVIEAARVHGPELIDAAITEARHTLDPSAQPTAPIGALSPQARAEIADAALEIEGLHRRSTLRYLDAVGAVLGRVLRAAVGA
jgi:hypothetical protein